MPITERLLTKATAGANIMPSPSSTPQETPWPAPSYEPSSTPTPTISATPPISPSISPTPSPSPASYFVYNASEFGCSFEGNCEGFIQSTVVYNPNEPLIIGAFYTASISKVYQINDGGTVNQLPSNYVVVDSRPYDSCQIACSPISCVSGSLVYYTTPGWISYVTCAGNTVYQEVDCLGTCSIDVCHQCGTIDGSNGPGGSGSMAGITSIVCGYDCFIPPSPSTTPEPSYSPSPSVDPSVTPTLTPTVTPTVTPTPTITLTPSVTSTPKISPSCTCPVGYTGSNDGLTCYSSSVILATSTSGSLSTTVPGAAADNRAYGENGVLIFALNTFDQQGNLNPDEDTYAFAGYTAKYNGTTTTPVTKFWSRRQNGNGVWDANPYWPGTQFKSDGPAYPGTLGFCTTVQVPSTKTYYIGIAGDNLCQIKINGTAVISQPTGRKSSNFKFWKIYPFVLNAGPNLIELQGTNEDLWGSFAAEIYDNTLAELSTADQASDLNFIFSTGDYLPARNVVWPDSCIRDLATGGWVCSESSSLAQGSKYGQAFCTSYSCPEGSTLDTTTPGGPYCRQVFYIQTPCNPSPSPTISVTPSATPSISVTPTVTPSVSNTPCATFTPTPTVSVTVTPTPSLGCSCYEGMVVNNNIYDYVDCAGTSVTGFTGKGITFCLDVNREYSRNILVNPGASGCECGEPTPSVSVTPTISVTPSVSTTPGLTQTPSPSVSKTPSVSVTPSVTTTPSISVTPSVTATSSISVTPSTSISATPSISVTPSTSISATPSISVTPSISTTPTATPSISITPSPSLTLYIYAGATGTYADSATACTNKNCGRSWYRDTPSWANGLIVYNDSSLTPFNGGGNWIVVDTASTFCAGTGWRAIQVDTNGTILDSVACP